MPERIQFKRQKNFRLPENCVRVTRPSKFGNPFKIGDVVAKSPSHYPLHLETRAMVLYWFEKWLNRKLEDEPEFLEPLRDKDLACFCPIIDKDNNYIHCHADVLLSYANDIPLQEIIDENFRTAIRQKESR